MDTRRWTAILAVTATVLTSCRVGGGASEEEYDAVRDAFNTSLSDFGGESVSLDISNGEIDCVAKALDVSVADLDDALREDEESDDEDTTEVFRCLSNDTVRSLFDAILGPEEDAAAAGYDRDCVLDKIVDAVDEWQKTDGDEADLEAALDEASQDDACRIDA